MTAAQLAARRKGGLALKAKLDAAEEDGAYKFYADLGRRYGHLGGRPRDITFEEVELARSLRDVKQKEVGCSPTDSLDDLIRLWAKQTGR